MLFDSIHVYCKQGSWVLFFFSCFFFCFGFHNIGICMCVLFYLFYAFFMRQFLQTEVQRLKDEVQEMHKDLTKHHSLINTDTMDEILERSLFIDEQIASQYSAVQTQRAVFEEMWDVTFQRVTNEQEIYEAQLHDLLQLKQENSYLTTIARQIGPYILSIAKVKERLEPRFQKPENDCIDTVVKICEDSAMTTEQNSCNEKSCIACYDRDSDTDNSLILLPSETLLKSSEFCWQG
uniref:Ring finger protein 207a n=1 Tax=Cyprinus carpio carpio TaxID=630221 RepID=A0A9J8DAG5_CYPCA